MAHQLTQAFDLLRGAKERNRLAHAFLITGPAGSGKMLLASKLIGLVNEVEGVGGTDLFGEAPEPVDRPLEDWEGSYVRILRPQSKSRVITVDAMRGLEKSFYQASPEGTWKVGVIVDADRMNEAACNAFLKTLEEPPEDSLLLLTTSEPQRLLPTILSRCVEISLLPQNNDPSARWPEWASTGLGEMVAELADGFGEIEVALAVRASFADLLNKRRATISAAHLSDQKDEVGRYKNATDGEWLKQRDAYFKGLIESDYLSERSLLIEALMSWMGDVARAQSGSEDRDFPQYAEAASSAAGSESVRGLLRRYEALEELKRRMETNAQEQLSLDVAFLKAFA